MENNINNNLKLSLYGGAGIGLLFGVIMGTSITPTVATMFGTLTTLLAGILGLNDTHFSNAKAVRVGSFGFACVIGAYIGLFVRSHNVLSPSLITLKEKYIAVGFSEEQALNFIAQKEFGMFIQTTNVNDILDGSTSEEASISTESSANNSEAIELTEITEQKTTHLVMANTQISKQHSSVLFSAQVELSGCDELDYTDNSLPLDEVLNNFELTGGVWEELAAVVTTEIISDKQKSILLTTKDAVCQIDSVQESSCDSLTSELVQTNYQTVLETMKNHSENWQIVALSIDSSILPDKDKLQSLRLAKNTLCGF